MRLLVVVQSPILGVLDATQSKPPRLRGLLGGTASPPHGPGAADLVPTVLREAVMEGRVRLARPTGSNRPGPYPSRWEGWLGWFKPRARLARRFRTEAGGALDGVRLMAHATACATGLDTRRHPCRSRSRVNETETVSHRRCRPDGPAGPVQCGPVQRHPRRFDPRNRSRNSAMSCTTKFGGWSLPRNSATDVIPVPMPRVHMPIFWAPSMSVS